MANDQNNQNQERGSANRSINGASQVVSGMGKQLIKQVGKKAITQGARMVAGGGIEFLFTNPAGWAVLTIVFVSVMTVFLLFGGAPTAIGGDLSNNPSPSGGANSSPGQNFSPGPDQSPLPPADLAEILKYVNIGTLANSNSNGKCFAQTNGACDGSFAGLSLTNTEKNFIYNIFKKLLRSQRYKDLLGNTPVNIYFFSPIHSGAIDGGAGYNNNDMAFFGFFRNGVGDKYKQQILIHESGHILDKRNGSNQLHMDLKSLNLSDGSACYDYNFSDNNGLHYIKSYAFRGGEGANGGARAESFAEALANNAICVSGYRCTTDMFHAVPINNYPSDCSNTYNWIKTNVFGGVDISN